MGKTEYLALSLLLRICEFLLKDIEDGAGLRNSIDDLRRHIYTLGWGQS